MNNTIPDETRTETTALGNARVVCGGADARVKEVLLGIDLHKLNAVVTVQLGGSPAQPAQRIATAALAGWVALQQGRHPGAKVCFIYEAGPCGYWLHRRLTAQGCEGWVCAPQPMNGARKTDKRDSRSLCRQLRERLNGDPRAFGVVHVPAPENEQRRALLRHRSALLKTCGQLLKRCKSAALLHNEELSGRWWRGEDWEKNLPEGLPERTAQIIAANRRIVVAIAAEIELANKEIEAMASELLKKNKEPLPVGVGKLTWVRLLLEMGDWSRFTGRRAVSSYTGLCPGEHSSGGHRVELSIDKQGNRVVRHLLIEAAWRLARHQPDYPPIKQFLGGAVGSRRRRRGIVAVARQLAVDLWRLATGRATAEKLGLKTA
jgi:transposase